MRALTDPDEPIELLRLFGPLSDHEASQRVTKDMPGLGKGPIDAGDVMSSKGSVQSEPHRDDQRTSGPEQENKISANHDTEQFFSNDDHAVS